MPDLDKCPRCGGRPAPGGLYCADHASNFFAIFDRECAAAHAAMDRKEAEMDKYGYGGPPGAPIAKVVGLSGFIPRTKP